MTVVDVTEPNVLTSLTLGKGHYLSVGNRRQVYVSLNTYTGIPFTSFQSNNFRLLYGTKKESRKTNKEEGKP